MPTSVRTMPTAIVAPVTTDTNYVLLSALVTGVYLLITKDNQMYVTQPHGFDYFLNVILALQYSAAVNVVIPCFFEIVYKSVSHRRWLDVFNGTFYLLFPLYAVLAAAAAGWYKGALFGSISGNLLELGFAGFDPFNETDLQNNAIIIMVIVLLFNFVLLPLYLLTCYCRRCIEFA